MMSDGNIVTILLGLAKFGGALVLLFIWIRLFQIRILPYLKSRKEDAGSATKGFPLMRTLVLVFVTFGAVWLAQLEFAHRIAADSPTRDVDQRWIQKGRATNDATSEVSPDTQEGLEDRTARLKATAAAENKAAKEKFIEKNAPPKGN